MNEMPVPRTHDDLTHVAANIKALMEGRGWTAYQLAKKSGLSTAVIYRVVDELNVPTLQTLLRLRDAFDCSLDDFLQPNKGRRSTSSRMGA